MPEIAPHTRLRTSPYYEATLAEGVISFTPYNQMLIPLGYGDSDAEYHRLMNGVSMWDVGGQRQVQITGQDAVRLAQILSPRDLSRQVVGQGINYDMRETVENLSDAEATFQKLEEIIVLTELKPGVMYSEKELAETVGFGRTPVREALQRLEIEGLVTIKQRKGIQITEVDSDVQLRLLEIQRSLQNFAAEYAAIRATDEDRRIMRKFGEELMEAGKAQPASRLEALSAVRKAHDLMVNACHNEFAQKTMRIVQGLSRRFWILHMKKEDFNIAAELHAKLLLDVANGHTASAIAASNALIDYLEAFAKKTKIWK